MTLRGAYGVGIEWFFLDHLALSADAINPLAVWSLTDSKTKSELDDGVMAAAIQVPDVVVRPIGDELLQFRRIEEVLANVGAVL